MRVMGEIHDEADGSKMSSKTSNETIPCTLTRYVGSLALYLTITHMALTGAFINVFQLFVCLVERLVVEERWRKRLRQLRSRLYEILLTIVFGVIYPWYKIKVNMYSNNVELFESLKKPVIALLVTNHTYEPDYIVLFTLMDQLGNLHTIRCAAKDELKYVPIIGWGLRLSDGIFLKRNWNKDRLGIRRQINKLLSQDQAIINLYAEGTRYSPEKYEASRRYAECNSMKPFKYHLTPKVRGFVFTLRQFLRENARASKNRPFKLINLECLMQEPLTFKQAVDGVPLISDVYLEEVDISTEILEEALESTDELDCEDCPKMRRLLFDIYRRKDEIVEQYKSNGNKIVMNSKLGGQYKYRPRITPLIVWLTSFCLAYGSISYLALVSYADSVLFRSILITYFAVCVLLVLGFMWICQVKQHEEKKAK